MIYIFTILFLLISNLSGIVYAQECTQPSCFQQKDKELTGLANTTSAPDRVPWFVDADGNMDLTPFTALGRSIVGATSASQINTILGVSLVTTHPRVTVATLPAVPVTNEVVVVTDALAASSCIVNGGTTNVTCQWTGAAWVAIGGGGGGGAVAGTDTQVQFNDSNIMAGDPGLTYDKASNVLTVTGDVIVAGQSVCQEDGTNCPSGGAPAFNTVTAGTNTDKLVIGTGGSLGVSGTGTITPQYTPSGSIAATTVQGAIAELDAEKQPLDADLTALAGNSTAGFWAAATNAARTLTGTAGNITITNGNGTVGNPVWDVGANVFLTTRSHTQTAGDVSFLDAASLKIKGAAGCAPTIEGLICTNLTTHRPVFGNGTTTKVFAFTDEIQPLNANLTGIAGLTFVNNQSPVYHGGAWTNVTRAGGANCNGAGQATNWDATAGTEGCVTISASGLSGGSAGTYTIATGATTFETTSSLISNSGSNVHLAGGLEVNCSGATCISITMADWAAHLPATVNLPYISGASPYLLPCTGALTSGHVLTVDAGGGCKDGGVAGAGDVVAAGPNTLLQTTMVATGAGGNNPITMPINAFWDAGAIDVDGTQCGAATSQVINSGPRVMAFSCADNAGSIFEGHIVLTHAIATATFTLTVSDVDSSAQHFAGGFKTQCRTSAAIDNTWGTSVPVDITMTTANIAYSGTTAAVTSNGTCSAGAILFWRFTMDAATNTDDGDSRVLGVLMKQVS